jgi:hypothetical protein
MLSGNLKAQMPLETFFSEIKQVVKADYSKKNLAIIENWSDSSYATNNRKKEIKQNYYKGILRTNEGAVIDFVFFVSKLKLINVQRSTGSIIIRNEEGCNAALLRSVLGFIPKYYISFDTVSVISGANCSCTEIRLHFNNYSPSTNNVLENTDTSLITLLKHEYYDFYFADVNRRTATWQDEFRTFMQPYSEALIVLLNKKNIKGVFDLISLRNKGYSWYLAEGLWYYNSIYPILNKEQFNIIDSYNGHNGMLFFRSSEELKDVYKF